MNKEFLKKNKKVFLISFAVLFVALMFFIKTTLIYKNNPLMQAGLTYNNETVSDLVNQDTDGDDILDWEESLWGTDPKNTDTFGHGLGDAAEITKMKQASGKNVTVIPGEEEKLTETDKFSRELFTTITALNQTGGLDQSTVDKLSASLAQQIENPTTKKVFVLSDIKTTSDTSVQAAQNYNTILGNLLKKYPTVYTSGGLVTPIVKTVADVLKAYLDSGSDASILLKLDPTIKDMNAIVDGMTKTTVPNNLATLHLNMINSFERVLENLNDIKTVDNDPIVAMGAASKFSDNTITLQSSIDKLITAINQGLRY